MNRRQLLHAGIGSGLAIAVAQASGIASFANAALAQNGDVQRYVIVDALNMRTGPGLDHGVVTVLHRGDILSISSDVTWSDGYGWIEAAVYGTSTSGWVVAEFIGESPVSTTPVNAVMVVNTDVLNLRSGPGLDYSVITGLSEGTLVTTTDQSANGDGYQWYYVTVNDQEGVNGWVAADFLVSGPGNTPQSPTYVHVDTDALNLRNGPGLGYSVIATYPTNTEALVTGAASAGDGYTWLPVRVTDGTEGWFAQDFLASGYADIPRDRVQVADGPLNVRWDPGLDSESFITVPTGAYGTVMDPQFVDADGYSWVYVQWDDSAVIGWSAMAFLSYIDVG